MVRSVTVFDEDFTEDDMTAALDWEQEKAQECPGCHRPLDETSGHGRDEAYATELVTCHFCASGTRRMRAYQEDGGDTAGVLTRTREVDD